jgi:hypothetical protein
MISRLIGVADASNMEKGDWVRRVEAGERYYSKAWIGLSSTWEEYRWWYRAEPWILRCGSLWKRKATPVLHLS